MAEEANAAEVAATKAKYGYEIDELKQQIANENDLAVAKTLKDKLKEKELALNTELYTKEQAYLQAVIKLEKEHGDAVSNTIEERRKKEELLAEIKQASLEDTDLSARLQTELEEIKSAHVQELDELRELGASKLEIEQAIADQTAQIRMQERDNERDILQQRLGWASGFAGNMAETFQGLAESGVGNSKKMFEAYKAFAITQTIISTYSSAMKSYESLASIPYVGPVLGAAAAAAAIGMGMAKVASIRASEPTGYAYGGMIDGPDQGARADNVTIRATPGEYMMDRPTVRHYGVRAMEALRQRIVPRELFSNLSLPAMRPAYAGPGFAFGGEIGRQNAPSPAPQQTTIVNLTDKSELDRYLASVEGQNAIMNIISTRSQTVRRIVGD